MHSDRNVPFQNITDIRFVKTRFAIRLRIDEFVSERTLRPTVGIRRARYGRSVPWSRPEICVEQKRAAAIPTPFDSPRQDRIRDGRRLENINRLARGCFAERLVG